MCLHACNNGRELHTVFFLWPPSTSVTALEVGGPTHSSGLARRLRTDWDMAEISGSVSMPDGRDGNRNETLMKSHDSLGSSDWLFPRRSHDTPPRVSGVANPSIIDPLPASLSWAPFEWTPSKSRSVSRLVYLDVRVIC